MIKGVLFDMDGVILDTERQGRTIFLNECAKRGYPQVDEIFYEKLLGQTREADCALMKEALGQEFPFDEMYEAYRDGLHALAEKGTLPTRPGVAECMKGLKARGIRIALATSTARPIVEMYQQHIPEMRDVFDFMVCGKEGGRSKPAPDIYLKAAAGIGVDISECIGVEDSLYGLRSIRAAGGTCVMVPDLLRCDERFAGVVDYELKDLTQLCPLIDRLNREPKAKA